MDLLTIVGQIFTCENGGRWYSTIIGTVLDHFQPNQMTQIGLGVQKVCFCNFFRFLLSVRVKKELKKNSKFFIAFSCLEWLKNSQILQKFQKSPKVGTVLGPFGPKTQNTTHQSSITPLLHSFYHILSSYKKLLKTVKPFSRYSTLKNRAMWLADSVWPKKGVKGFFSEKSVSASFYPLLPPNFMQKIRKI